MRLLLVEDDVKIAQFVMNGLREAGFAVDHADNGEDGLHLALTEPYDIAVVDLMLPKVDGFEIAGGYRFDSGFSLGGNYTHLEGESVSGGPAADPTGDDTGIGSYTYPTDAELEARVRAVLEETPLVDGQPLAPRLGHAPLARACRRPDRARRPNRSRCASTCCRCRRQ